MSNDKPDDAFFAAKQPGLLLVISGPSGVGKTTITHEVERQLRGVFSISVTSRPQTAADRDGVDYHFVTADAFIEKRDAGQLLEWADVFGNYYGTPREPVEQAMKQGRLVILEIDVQGAIQIKANMPDAFAVFIEPPSEEVLLGRLRKRQRESEEIIQKRFSKAKLEIAKAHECGVYDEFIVNDDLELAIDHVVTAVTQARASRSPFDQASQ